MPLRPVTSPDGVSGAGVGAVGGVDAVREGGGSPGGGDAVRLGRGRLGAGVGVVRGWASSARSAAASSAGVGWEMSRARIAASSEIFMPAIGVLRQFLVLVFPLPSVGPVWVSWAGQR
jgi:hypothetical protein